MQTLIILPIIALIIFFIFRKNKKDDGKSVLNNRTNRKDEVWRTIKAFLKEKGEFGKEITYSFVAKRPNVFSKSATKKKFHQELEKTIKEQNMSRKDAKAYRKKMQKEQNRERYCIFFKTADAKTHTVDPARIIEAEVLYNVVKKERKREIKINGLMDFDKEFAWMKPLKEREDKLAAKIAKRRQISQEKKARAKKRKDERAMRKEHKKNLHSVS